jgi:ribonuclease Z
MEHFTEMRNYILARFILEPSSPKQKPPRRLATVHHHPPPHIATPEMASTSLISLPSLRLLSRASAPPASRFHTLAARKPAASTAVSGGGLLSVLDRALADEEEYRRARSQVQRKGVEAEGYGIEGLSVGGHETCITVPSLNVAFDIGRGPSFAVSQDYLFITHAHLDHIVSAPGPCSDLPSL